MFNIIWTTIEMRLPVVIFGHFGHIMTQSVSVRTIYKIYNTIEFSKVRMPKEDLDFTSYCANA